MKIAHIRSNVVRLPAEEPLAHGPVAPGATRDIVILRIDTDESDAHDLSQWDDTLRKSTQRSSTGICSSWLDRYSRRHERVSPRRLLNARITGCCCNRQRAALTVDIPEWRPAPNDGRWRQLAGERPALSRTRIAGV